MTGMMWQLSLGDYVHLSRYLLALLFFAAALLLLFSSLGALLKRFRQQSQPVQGFFLMMEARQATKGVQSFPLYHTSALGRARSSDLRLRDRSVARHHALIYLFNGKWYLSRVSSQGRLRHNDKTLHKDRRLRHGDAIQIGDCQLAFVDERLSAEQKALPFEATVYDAAWHAPSDPVIPTAWPWFLTSLCSLLLFATLLFRLPEHLGSLRPELLGFGLAFFVLAQSGYLLWPRIFEQFDRVIYTGIYALASLGFVMQMRLTLLSRPRPARMAEGPWLDFLHGDLLKQAFFPLLGLMIMPIVMAVISKTRWLERLAPLCLLLTPGLYLSSLLWGSDVAGTGARLWISLPMGFSLQPSEFAKLSYLLVLAYFFKIRPPLKKQLFFGAWTAFNLLLIMRLPDLGSMMILLPCTLLVFTTMTSEWLKSIFLAGTGLGIAGLAYQFFPYVQSRIHGFLTLFQELNDQNRQIIYGLQAIGRGGIFGLGLGKGHPAAIPLASSDMIFAMLCEEFGLLLGLAVVFLFLVISLRGALAVTILRDGFSASLVLAVSSIFLMEAAVVMGGTAGLIPLTGATLPFIARGGSSMLAKWLMAALLLGLWNRREKGAYRR